MMVAQEQTDTALAEAKKSTNAATFTAETNMASEPGAAVDQSTIQQDVSQEVSLRSTDDIPMTQVTTDQQDLDFKPKSVEPQSNTSAFVDEIVANQTDTDKVETANTATQPVTQMDMPEKPALEAQPIKSTSETVETKNAEKQVNVGAQEIGFSQSVTKPVENSEAATATNVEISEVDVIFVEPNEKFNSSRTVSTNESSKIISNKESLPVSPLNNDDDYARSDISIKVETGRQVLKTKPAISKDEEILPTEKQPRQNQMPEPAAVTTGPIKEAMTIEVSGKVPAGQVDAQAAEVVQQMVHQMNVKLKSGPTSMHLQLNPKELGTIDVEMVSTSQGVRVTFFAEQANTGKLLETQLNQLRESLIDSGVQLSGLNISQHGPSEQKGGFFSQDKNFTQYPQSDITRSEPDITETSRTERIARQSGEVDYLI